MVKRSMVMMSTSCGDVKEVLEIGREIVETDEEYRRRMRNQQAAWKVIRMDD
jgi:hypothetical protein